MWKELSFFPLLMHSIFLHCISWERWVGILYTAPWSPASLELLIQAHGDKLRVFTAGSSCPRPRNCVLPEVIRQGGREQAARSLQRPEDGSNGDQETVNNVPGVYHWVWKWKPLSQSNFDYNNFKKSLAVSTSLKIIQLSASVAAFLLFLPLWLSRWLQNLHLESQLAS